MYRSNELEEFFKMLGSISENIAPDVMRKSSDANLAGLREAVDNVIKAGDLKDAKEFTHWAGVMVGEFKFLDSALKSGMPIPTDWNKNNGS